MRISASASVSLVSTRALVQVPAGPSGCGAAPARVAAVVDRVQVARLAGHEVVGVAEPGGVDLHRPTGHQPRLVLAVVAAERVVGVGGAGSVLVVEGGQVERAPPSAPRSTDSTAADSAYSGSPAKLCEGAPLFVWPP